MWNDALLNVSLNEIKNRKGYNMSRIEQGQTFDCNIVDILNTHFTATTAQGMSLNGWYKSAWPWGAPFLINIHDTRREETVVWFPVVTDNPNFGGTDGWLNIVDDDRRVITTRHVGDAPIQENVFEDITRFIGKNHIIFARWEDRCADFEFYGVYTCTRQGETLVYRRFVDWIKTDDWQR